MVPFNDPNVPYEYSSRDKIAYVRHMLGELRQVALGEGADMLCYLIEMAYVEAGDLQAGRRPRSVFPHGNPDY